MRLPIRTDAPTARRRSELPGVVGVARVGRRARALLPRLRPGDIALIDQVDLDRATAQELVDAGVRAVVNVGPMLSGRYPALGPEALAAAGVPLLEQVGPEAAARVRDGRQVRLHDTALHVEDEQVASGRAVGLDQLREEMAAARTGLATQLESFTRNSAEFLRREQDLLLHGVGIPKPRTRLAGRSVVVVVPGHDHLLELEQIRPYLREQEPVIIAVGEAADDLRERGHRAHVVVVDAVDETGLPSAAVLRAATDVVVRADRGRAGDTGALGRLGVSPLRIETGAGPEDVALLLADAGDAALVVGVGMHATLEEFLDRQRPGLASTYLTRLRLGPRLVDAAAVPRLYSGRVRPHHLLLVMFAGLVALCAAVGVTPVGQEWFDQLQHLIGGLLP